MHQVARENQLAKLTQQGDGEAEQGREADDEQIIVEAKKGRKRERRGEERNKPARDQNRKIETERVEMS